MNDFLPEWLLNALKPVESGKGRPSINRGASKQLDQLEESPEALAERMRVLESMKPPPALRDQKRLDEIDERLRRRQETLDKAARGEL